MKALLLGLAIFSFSIQNSAMIIEEPEGSSGLIPAITGCQTSELTEKLLKNSKFYFELSLRKNAPVWKINTRPMFFGQRMWSAIIDVGYNGQRPIKPDIQNPEMYVINKAFEAFNLVAAGQPAEGGGCTNAHYQVEQFGRDLDVVFSSYMESNRQKHLDCIMSLSGWPTRMSRNDFDRQLKKCYDQWESTLIRDSRK